MFLFLRLIKNKKFSCSLNCYEKLLYLITNEHIHLNIIYMKTLFENKKNKIDFNKLLKDILIKAPISGLIFSIFKFIMTWTKPTINEILIFILILSILKLIKFLIHNYRNHLESISIDFEKEKIIFNHVRPSKKRTLTVMNLEEIKVSKIKYLPISWFSFVNYLWVSDEKSEIKISTAGHKNKEINLVEIHSKLKKIQHSYTTNSLLPNSQ